MRVAERHRQEEGPAPCLGLAREVVQALHREVLDLVVVVDLQAAHARSGLQHVVHADAGWLVVGRPDGPVRRPGEIGGVDVGGEAFLVAVQLVGADEVHLAGQDRAVAGRREGMRERRHRRRQLAGVVVGADGGRQPAAQHGEAGRRADRRVAVGGVEHHAAVGDRLQMRRLHHPAAIAGQGCGRHLVGHHEEDVRLCHGLAACATRCGRRRCGSPRPSARARS
jgi:hypothetical protein